MFLLPKLRLLLARRPWLYWVCAALCALLAWMSVAAAHDAAARQQHQWGTTRAVWVTTRATGSGDALVAERREYPLALVPADAVDGRQPLPTAATAAHPLAVGEVVVEGDLSGAVRAPEGWVAFAVVTAGGDVPQLVPGDEAALFGQGTRWCDGVVLAATDDAVEVAVPPDCADGLSAVVAVGEVVLARSVSA